MPIELTDDQGNPLDLEKADGKTLRTKLEQALAENKTLAQEVTTFKAQKAIEANGLSLVTPEDLAGVALDEIDAKALELQTQRQAARAETVKGIFRERGLEGDALEQAVQGFLAGGESLTPTPKSDEPDLTDMLGLGGRRPSQGSGLVPLDDAMGNLVDAFS